ncbi:MAG: RND transporter [Pedosphaera sp. Tous-C6FEB]|nr:MAG: RND transporter [Pedosphaera sp. Tous-C6FEB]
MAMSTPAPSTTAARRNGQRNFLRRLVPWGGGLALLGLLVAGLWPKPIKVETTRVTTGPLRVTINDEGKTRIKQRYVVTAPVTGYLRRLPWKAGAEVAGSETVVAVIEPLPPALLDARTRTLAEARREVAVAQLARAREAHKFAASELRRVEKLQADKVVSPQEFESVLARESATARELAVAESALRQAEAELVEFNPPSGGTNSLRAPVEVKAPVAGRVLRVFEENARVVPAGTPLLELGDPAELEAVIEVLSRDGAALATGTKVELEHWGGPQPLRGQVRLVEPAAFTKVSALGVEEQRVNVVVELLTPVADRASLGDNFRVEGRIILWEEPRALKVPAGALFRRGSEWAAFVLAGEQVQLRPVKTGRNSGTEMQILSGLNEGDTVILYPGDRLQDGQRVQPLVIAAPALDGSPGTK